jgi:NitT/TauT family transport system permease protein
MTSKRSAEQPATTEPTTAPVRRAPAPRKPPAIEQPGAAENVPAPADGLGSAPEVVGDRRPTGPRRRSRLRRWRRRVGPPSVVFVLVLVLWYAGSYLLIDAERRFLLPAPHEVLVVGFLDLDNLLELLEGLSLSAGVATIGLAVAAVLGLGLAILMSQTRWLEHSLYPYAVMLQTVPILALVPLFGFWFGYGYPSRVLACVLIALFPIVANSLFGLRSVDGALHDLFTLHDAGRLTRLVKLQLPAALPAILTGLRISAGAAVIGAIVGDFFFQQGPAGLGQLIYLYPRRLQSEMLFAAVILASVFGLLVFWIFGAIARRATAWHESQHARLPAGSGAAPIDPTRKYPSTPL